MPPGRQAPPPGAADEDRAAAVRGLPDAWMEAAEGAFSANTRRALKSDLRIYSAWCAEERRQALPATPDTIAAFVDAMAATRAPATVRRYVASIAAVHRAIGSPEAPKSPEVKLALKRMHRDRGRRQHQAPGLTWPLRQRLVEAAGDRPIDVRNRALLAVAYDTMLRRSELAALRVCDLAVDRTGAATVLVRDSKTDAEGEGAVLYIAPDSLALVAEWLELSGVRDGQLFRSLSRGELGEALDPSQIPRIYKAMARRAGVEADLAGRLSGHSTRVGAAQDMVAHGIELPAIQQAGRWKSTGMVNRYGERLLAQRGGAAQLAHMQGRDRPVARRWPPALAGSVAPTADGDPDKVARGAHRRQALRRSAQHKAHPQAPPPERERQRPQRPARQPGRQLQRQPGEIRLQRAGPEDRHDMPGGAPTQTVEEIVRQRRLGSRPRVADAVEPWPVSGSGPVPSRPGVSAPAASPVGLGFPPRNRLSKPFAACTGRAIENCRIGIDDRSAFTARAPP